MFHDPKTVNPRTLLSHVIAVEKTREGKIGQRFKEEMPAAKQGVLSFLSTDLGGWSLRQAGLPALSQMRQRVLFVNQSLPKQRGRLGQVCTSFILLPVKSRMLVPCLHMWMFHGLSRGRRGTGEVILRGSSCFLRAYIMSTVRHFSFI